MGRECSLHCPTTRRATPAPAHLDVEGVDGSHVREVQLAGLGLSGGRGGRRGGRCVSHDVGMPRGASEGVLLLAASVTELGVSVIRTRVRVQVCGGEVSW